MLMIAAMEGQVERHAEAETTFREQGPRLWRSLLLSSGDREVASDAVAEAFAQLLARGPDVRDPAAWVWRAAFKIAAGQMKERASVDSRLPDVAVDQPESVTDLLRALATLSASQRTAVVLADYAGYRHREIATIVGSTAGAVAVQAHRGRRRL
jgi:RNA polymerase sigma-70 factor, ECF subfamily